MLVAHTFGHGRSALAVAAGASHLPLRRFLAIEAIEVPAALIWSALYAGGGYVLGGELQTFELVLRRLGWFGAALVLAGFAAWWYRERHRAPPARGSPWLRRRALPAAADEGLVHGPGRSAPVESGAGGT